MEDKIRVLISEDEVNEKIKKLGEQIQQRLCWKINSPDLRIKGRRFYYV